jgi:hypothetical protein
MVHTLRYGFLVALLMLAIVAPAARAQQQEPQAPQQPQNQGAQPVPAGRGPLLVPVGGSGDAQDVSTSPQELAPDTRPLAGAQTLSLGLATGHSFWQPHFDVTSTAESNALVSTSNAAWTTWTSLSAGVDLHRISGSSNLTLSYLGIGSISNDGSSGNAVTQQLGLAESLTWRRTVVSLMDQVAYLPEAAFGYSGFGSSTQAAGGSLGLQPGFTPAQSILTSLTQSISNTSIIQSNTFLTRRTSLTFVGSYGLLDYFGNNLLNNNEMIFGAGYNYQWTRKDTIALLYNFDGFRYSNGSQSINAHSVQFSYARRVTGRMAFQIAGGPEVTFSRIPIPTSAGSSSVSSNTGSTTGKTRQFFWGLNTSLTYQLRRTALGLSYSHGVSGGSGVLAGSLSDNATGTASRQFTRRFNGALTAGYSRNTGLAVTSSSVSTLSSQTYNFWFGGVNFTRTWGRSINLALGYQLQYQDSNSAFCVTATCGTNLANHLIFLALGWHPRPLAL